SHPAAGDVYKLSALLPKQASSFLSETERTTVLLKGFLFRLLIWPSTLIAHMSFLSILAQILIDLTNENLESDIREKAGRSEK
ncbi:hypothetical protein STEG23_031403, partial [Scotinomys teguina]